jgi:hypothetical protein
VASSLGLMGVRCRSRCRSCRRRGAARAVGAAALSGRCAAPGAWAKVSVEAVVHLCHACSCKEVFTGDGHGGVLSVACACVRGCVMSLAGMGRRHHAQLPSLGGCGLRLHAQPPINEGSCGIDSQSWLPARRRCGVWRRRVRRCTTWCVPVPGRCAASRVWVLWLVWPVLG